LFDVLPKENVFHSVDEAVRELAKWQRSGLS
jgi:hypothetical protein